MNKNVKKRPRLYALDGLRIIMIMIVVFCHCSFLEETSFSTIFNACLKNGGGHSVDFFFILSGFGIYYVENGNHFCCSIKNNVKYAVNRVRKIYPLYLFSLLLGLFSDIPLLLSYKTSLLKTVIKITVRPFLNLFLLQSITGMSTFSHAINGVSWYLSALFIAYMFCPYFVNLVNRADNKKKIAWGMVFTIGVILFFSRIALYMEGTSYFDNIYSAHPFIRCLYLLFGMYISSAFNRVKFYYSRKVATIIEVLVCTVYLATNIFADRITSNPIQLRAMYIITTGLIIYTFAVSQGSIASLLSSRRMTRLGKDAMYIFLLHYPIILFVVPFCKKLHIDTMLGNWIYPIWIIIILLGTYLLMVLYKKIEVTLLMKCSPIFETANKILS